MAIPFFDSKKYFSLIKLGPISKNENDFIQYALALNDPNSREYNIFMIYAALSYSVNWDKIEEALKAANLPLKLSYLPLSQEVFWRKKHPYAWFVHDISKKWVDEKDFFQRTEESLNRNILEGWLNFYNIDFDDDSNQYDQYMQKLKSMPKSSNPLILFRKLEERENVHLGSIIQETGFVGKNYLYPNDGSKVLIVAYPVGIQFFAIRHITHITLITYPNELLEVIGIKDKEIYARFIGYKYHFNYMGQKIYVFSPNENLMKILHYLMINLALSYEEAFDLYKRGIVKLKDVYAILDLRKRVFWRSHIKYPIVTEEFLPGEIRQLMGPNVDVKIENNRIKITDGNLDILLKSPYIKDKLSETQFMIQFDEKFPAHVLEIKR